jgi:hypothetical protein
VYVELRILHLKMRFFCIIDDRMHFSKKDFGKNDWIEISNVKTYRCLATDNKVTVVD